MALRQVAPNVFELVGEGPVEEVYTGTGGDENAASEDSNFKIPSTLSAVERYARRRLQKDYREVMLNPLPTVAAKPSKKNLFVWHGNLAGPEGTPFYGHYWHIVLRFPRNYPAVNPRVQLLTRMNHKHVYGSWVCLDMFENDWIPDYNMKLKEPGTGWSTAYTVQAILIQLQSFLFQKSKVPQHSIKSSLQAARHFKCTSCGHSNRNPQPAPLVRAILEGDDDDEEEEQKGAASKPPPKRKVVVRSNAHPAPAPAPTTPKAAGAPAPSPPVGGVHVTKSRKRRKRKNKSRGRSDSTSTVASGESSSAAPSLTNGVTSRHHGPSASAASSDDTGGNEGAGVATRLTHKETPERGMKLRGIVRSVPRFGAFVDVGWRKHGLVHVSRVRHGFVEDLTAELQPGDEVDVWVLGLERNKHGEEVLSLTMLGGPPLAMKDIRYDKVYEGTVLSVKPFGAFVSFGAEVDGLLHISELGKVVFEIERFLSVGDAVSVKVLGVDSERRRVSLRLLRDDERDANPTRADFAEHRSLRLVPDDVFHTICGFLPMGTNEALARMSPRFERIIGTGVDTHRIRSELVCFHSKYTYLQDILGLGMNVERYEWNKTAGALIKHIHPTLDLLGAAAYFHRNQREGVWKEKLTHWLPLYICASHGRRSLPQAVRQIKRIHNNGDATFSESVLEIVPKLLNTMVVNTMNGDLHESIRALQGYCYFYHLLLALCEKYPVIRRTADQRIASFLEGEWNRNKRAVPNLGQWITYLLISDTYAWSQRDVPYAYLEECFDRNVKWIVAAHPKLGKVSEVRSLEKDNDRLRLTFDATKTSLRLAMFHVLFLKTLRYDKFVGGGKTYLSVKQVKKRLDRTYGRPDRTMESTIQDGVKAIKAVDSYDAFFESIDTQAPSRAYVLDWLEASVGNSERRRYHFKPKPKAAPTRREPEFDADTERFFDAEERYHGAYDF